MAWRNFWRHRLPFNCSEIKFQSVLMHIILRLFQAIVAATALSGCVASSSPPTAPAPRPLGNALPTFQAPALEAVDQTLAEISEEPVGELDLRRSLALALLHNPALATFSWEVRAAEARVLQAGLYPNPEFEAELEEFAGGDERSGLDSAVTTLQLSQLIELGGKRTRRTRVALLEQEISQWDYEVQRLDVFTNTTKDFVGLLGAQQRRILAESFLNLAEQVREVAAERVQAGKVSPLELTKAEVTLAGALIDLERAERDVVAVRKRLASNWGSTSPQFDKVTGPLYSVQPIPLLHELLARVEQNPDIERWMTELELRRATVDLERSAAIPDVTLRAGVQRFREDSSGAMIVGVAIPLPVFNRNQGAILEARRRVSQAGEQRRSVHVQTVSNLGESYEAAASAHQVAVRLRDEVLPAADKAFEGAAEGYQLGKFGFLDVLDAQRTLFEVNVRYLDALIEYHISVAELERLIGEPIDAAAPSLNSNRDLGNGR